MRTSTKHLGLIINLFNAKEADKVLHLLTESGSKISFIAKGVKKTASKKAHAIDLLNLVEVKLENGAQLPILSEIKLVNAFSDLKKEYLGLCFVQALCEIISQTSQEEIEEPILWQITQQTLLKTNLDNIWLALSQIYLKSFQILGLLPDLSTDPESGETLNSEEEIGFLLPYGFTNQFTEQEQKVSTAVYKAIRFILVADTNQCFKLQLDREKQKEMFKIVHLWATNLLEKRLPAGEMLR